MALTNLEYYILEPKAATNLITNPSFETSTDGWEVSGGAMARSTTYQRRGAYSLQIAPTNLTESLVYYEYGSGLTSSVAYNFSVDVHSSTALTYSCYFATTGDVALTTPTTWTGNGYWQRRCNTYTATDAINVRLYVSCSSAATSDDLWYIDGAQLESGAESSYFDGDMTGFLAGVADFGWNGTPHGSSSWRSGQTRRGGTEMRLKDVLPGVFLIAGLGMGPLVNHAIPHVLGGSHYQNTVYTDRTITLSTEFSSASLGGLMADRDDLIDALNPHAVASDQPIVLRIKGLDSSSAEMMDTVDIPVLYSGGLEGAWEQQLYEPVAIQFQSFLPYITSEGTQGAQLTYNLDITETNAAVRRVNGVWASLSTGFTTDQQVNSFVQGNDGNIYIGGNFTDVGGADGDYIISFNPTTTAVTNMTSGTNGIVYSVAQAPNGNIYIGGNFTGASGVANTSKIAYWDGAKFNPISTGITSDYVNALAFGKDGTLYVAGTFENQGDAAGDGIVSWTGSAWASLGTGVSTGTVNVAALTVGLDGSIYAGGAFTEMGGIAGTAYVAKWNGSAWSALGTGMDGSVNSMATGPDGSIYAGGEFHNAGGILVNHIAKWNGAKWQALGTGMDNSVYSVSVDSKGNVYASGQFVTAGGVSVPDRLARWNGSSWTPIGITLPVPSAGSVTVYGIYPTGPDDLFLGFTYGGTATAAAVTTVTNGGTSKVYPRIKFTGGGRLYELRNLTTGKDMYFNLTLNAGEKATLNLNPDNPSFISTFRGNIKNTVLPGSSWDFFLQPGVNDISLFISGSTDANTDAVMWWTPNYTSLDGAVH